MPRYSDEYTLADLLEQLGHIDPKRIRMTPLPGTATEKDVIRIEQRENRLCELIDGVLVEKIMGFREGYLSQRVGHLITRFVDERDLGIVAGADGTVRLMKGLVRIPDVSFVSWEQLPSRTVPDEPIPDLAPDLAVEILSKGNTPGEMERKLKEYFLAGVRLVWFIDPRRRTAQVFTSPDQSTIVPEKGSLDGGDVLPGFRLPLTQIFERLAPRSDKKTTRKRSQK
jgi:Uma2 family endonuclease